MICRAQDFSPVRGGPFLFAILSERVPIQRSCTTGVAR